MKPSKTYNVTIAEVNNKTNNSPDNTECQREGDRKLYDLTSISECLSVAMHEYSIERNKKQSFDDRAGIIITIFAAIIIVIYDKIPLAEIIEKMYQPLTLIILLQIITGCLFYIGLIASLIHAVMIIAVKPSKGFDLSIISSEFIWTAKIYSVSKLLETYLSLANIHRSKNEDIAKELVISQRSMIISIISLMIYLILLTI